MVAMIAALVLLAAWLGWFCLVPVTVRETSRQARIEVQGAARALSAEQSGRLVANGLYPGRRVHAGEVLAELDDTGQRARLAEAEARLAAFPNRLVALTRENAAAREALAGATGSVIAEAGAARARARAAGSLADFDRKLAAMRRADATSGGSAPVDAARSEAEAQRSLGESEARRLEAAGSTAAARASSAERRGIVAHADAALAALEAERAETAILVEHLRSELAARRIVAPVDGVIGDVTALRVGDVVAAGGQLATLVPTGSLHVVAQFDAGHALGRIAPGQEARLQLDGFSWAQYGDVQAQVEQVAAEPREDRLRVDFVLVGSPGEIPLRHGMPGTIDVAIEETTPAMLALRALGRWLA